MLLVGYTEDLSGQPIFLDDDVLEERQAFVNSMLEEYGVSEGPVLFTSLE